MRTKLKISKLNVTGFSVLFAMETIAAQLPDDLKEAPKRIVNGVAVDLSPLVNWYLNGRKGPQPLPHWTYINASFVEVHPYGWVILEDQKAYILKNPPKEKLVEHQRLSARLRALEAQLKRLQTSIDAESRLRAKLDREQATARQAGTFNDQNFDRSMASFYRSNAARSELALVKKEIDELKQHPLRPAGPFRVQCYVFNTKQQIMGREILDRGFPMR
jgi:hypothetical protein